jgi:zinc transporter, ZIP family
VTLVPTGIIILLGAFAGLTIYLGLPLAFFKKAPQSFKSFASMFAAGILVFLFFDVVGKASEPINTALETLRKDHTGGPIVLVEITCVVLGFLVGLLGLVYFNKYVIARYKPSRNICIEEPAPPVLPLEPVLVGASRDEHVTTVENNSGQTQSVSRPGGPTAVLEGTGTVSPASSPKSLALIIAVGIGLHNFSEGLAIGQSAAAGMLSVATILIIGFGLHNMTEGFGIAGPLTTEKVSWKFVALVGLIGGGPTFLGTVIGTQFYSDLLFILFLALAAGSILYIIVELLGVAKRMASLEVIAWGLAAGFLLGYLTDLIVTYAGA